MTITEKGKYIDDQIMCSNIDEYKVHEYLCDIVRSINRQRKIIRGYNELEMFVNDAASDIMMRLIDKTKPRVENCISYTSVTMMKYVERFRKMTFNTIIDPEQYNDSVGIRDSIEKMMVSGAQFEITQRRGMYLNDFLQKLPSVISDKISKTRYAADPKIKDRLTISALLTMMTWITPTLEQRKRLKTLKGSTIYQAWKDRYAKENSNLRVVNYGLSSAEYEHLDIMLRKLYYDIKKEIMELTNDELFDDDIINNTNNNYLTEVLDEKDKDD